MQLENVTFTGRDGLKLTGVLHYPQKYDKDSSILIICHGFRGNMDGNGHAAELSRKVTELGLLALQFDFSGTGNSEGDFADISLTNYIVDLKRTVDFVTSFTGGEVIVLGRSFGGTTAICEAAQDERVAAVCAWAAPVDLRETFFKPAQEYLASSDEPLKIPEGDGYYFLKRRFFEDLFKYNILEAVEKLSNRPLLVIHGTADETVSFAQGLELFTAANGPKDCFFVENANHRFVDHYEIVQKKTVNWIKGLLRK